MVCIEDFRPYFPFGNIVKNIRILFILLALTALSCMSPRDNSNRTQNSNVNVNADANSANSNLEELRLLINVPYETEDLAWKKEDGSEKIVAVLRFAPEDADKIAAESGPAAGKVSLSPESWYPSELTAQSETSGDNGLEGTAYDPKLFVLAPYTQGRLVRIDGTNYFLLELS
ncbi:MAG: hypothetical protein JSS77_12475 [Acidobacteria bacterium]|nr:hypothetical protein [Acidobacteriota bacterium]